MPKSLRLPLAALVLGVILLGMALYSRLGDGDSTPTPEPTQSINDFGTPPPIGNPVGDGSPIVGDVSVTPTPNPITVVSAPPAAAPSRSDRPTPTPAHLREALVGEIRKLNPLFASYNPVDRDITSLIFEGLTTINEYGEVVPLLAERWEVSRDGLTYIFALRRDVLWQDGIPFTSADVQYTINVMRDPDFPGDKALTQFWRTMEMTVIDEYTLRFRLVQPLASFPEHLRFGILPVHALRDYPVAQLDRHRFNLTPIGTGPYQVESLLSAPGQGRIAGVVLRVSPNYRLRPEGQNGFAIDRITFRTYQSVDQAIGAFARGEVDSIASLPAEALSLVMGLQYLNVNTAIYPSVGFLIYNWQRDELRYLQDQRMRLALARGLDRHGAVQRHMASIALPADSPLLPNSWAFDLKVSQYPPYDVELAKSMIASVSFENPEATATPETTATEAPTVEGTETPAESTDTPPVVIRRNLTILVLNEAPLVGLAQDIATQWSALGLTVSVDAVEQDVYLQRLYAHDFDTAIVEYSFAPFADPDSFPFWHIGQYPDGLNYGGMRDIQVSDVLLKARRETVGINRALLYHEFQRLFTQRASALALYYPLYVYITDVRLQDIQLGFISSPEDRFRTIRDWTWELN